MAEKDKNILIIDDEVQVVKSLERQFRRKYNVYTANSGQEALDLMGKENIQVIISDQRMPGMTGVDFFHRIKDTYTDISKIVLTGYSDIEAVISAINEGQVFRYVGKPWNPNELEIVVNEAFDKNDLLSENKKLVAELKEINHTLEEKVSMRTAELEVQNASLHDLNIEKNKYIGIVAHDLRNPIGIAGQFSKLLVERYDRFTPDKQMNYLSIINERCTFSLDLIENFLDVSKIESGIFELKLKEIEYIGYIQGILEQNRILTHEKSQEIVLITDIPEVSLKLDPGKIEQVINNLISNASKYSDPNNNIFVEIVRKDSTIYTSIMDQGEGIEANELDTVFNPYQITTTKSTADEKSTGLGLAIVKKIIDAHHGKITVESEVGKGSVFTFSLK